MRVNDATPANRLTYRPITSRVGAVAYLVFAAWWAGAQLVAGRWSELAVAAPLLVAVGALVYGVFWRPAVIVDDDRVELRNVVRDVVVRWPALEALETRFALTLIVGERQFRSWAAAAPGRPSPIAPSPTGPTSVTVPGAAPPSTTGGSGPAAAGVIRSSRNLAADSGAAAFMVEQRWQQRRDLPADGRSGDSRPGDSRPGDSRPGDDPVQVRWVRSWPAVTAAGLLLGALGALLG